MTGISKSTAPKLYNEQTTRIDFETMDRICEALEIQVGDLYSFIPNDSVENNKEEEEGTPIE